MLNNNAHDRFSIFDLFPHTSSIIIFVYRVVTIHDKQPFGSLYDEDEKSAQKRFFIFCFKYYIHRICDHQTSIHHIDQIYRHAVYCCCCNKYENRFSV